MPKKHRVNHKLNKIKVSRSYKIVEAAELLNVRNETVYNWLKEWLEAIGCYPMLIHGSELKAFLKSRKKKRGFKLKDDEMLCFKCRRGRKVLSGEIEVEKRAENKINFKGKCEVCKTQMNRNISSDKLHYYQNQFAKPTGQQLTLIGF